MWKFQTRIDCLYFFRHCYASNRLFAWFYYRALRRHPTLCDATLHPVTEVGAC